jgi:hypothetical protein
VPSKDIRKKSADDREHEPDAETDQVDLGKIHSREITLSNPPKKSEAAGEPGRGLSE